MEAIKTPHPLALYCKKEKYMDLFDLEKEKKIIGSGVRNIFTPYQPIMDKDLFFGRSKEVANIIRQLNTPGQHSVLFGDRGVGKSSLANISAEMLKGLAGGKLIKKRCDSQDNFKTIIESLLTEVGINLQITSLQHEKAEGGKAGLSIPAIVNAGIDTKTINTTSTKGLEDKATSPSWVAQQVKTLNALFLLDEIDVIAKEEKWKIAELVKQLSDEGSGLKFLIVGIAETASQLTHGHESVQRCLKETPLRKMSDPEIECIIKSGAEKVGLNFAPSAIRKIVKVSSGYPHFAHLLALKASEAAIGEGRKDIQLGHIQSATNDATGDAEGILRTKYNDAIRSSNTEEFKKILVAAATINQEEFSAANLRDSYYVLWGAHIEQYWLNNYLQKIVANDSSSILRRLAKGVYKFTDPRMPSYIRLANLAILPDVEQENPADS